ncbi:60S ribosomal protein L29 [Galemys pyrenaicus]|uniref:60S ribosomal protein L29 n=1 Tax=Galemys pyrenaicus TaxID=202257 RepID=A0A8J6A7U0_GALPY|nr:60S ribosomal protein L29 [Galemys pyrenaicus]
MRFAKKGLKKMQANNAKAMSVCAEAIKVFVKTKMVRANIPKGSSCKLRPLAYIAHPKLEKHAYARIAKGFRLSLPKPRLKPTPKKPRMQLRHRFQKEHRLPKVPSTPPPQRLKHREPCLPM